ncbi:R-phenyllactate dehydratase beta subunit [Ruminiclostridium hungatei]|uniref:R-phenyllactate dehydratase beta subunit n=1 Tax=Ruminiclostridium hungatei TaxID=48256 RepID=A0A1V4SNC0_RUMHU|nr:2-hydroxyacyl-CoA dehydratase family protein [Ruminiclostridium hungatei]OPX44976.1 R-phenyllactate dehydratase beta subunit [Ruminiclostridium hungatei]
MAIKTLDIIRRRVEERPEELKKERANGKKVLGWIGYHIPEEVAYSLGFIPIRISVGGDSKLVEVGARYASSKTCVFLREIVGAFAENTDPYIQETDVLAFDATCLQNFRAAEVIEYFFKRDVVVLGVPRNVYWEEAIEYFTQEAKEFTRLLEERAGVSVDKKKLAEAVDLFNKIRAALKEIYQYQASKGNVISWLEVYDLIQAGYVLDKQEYLQLLQQTLAELKEQQSYIDIEQEAGEARIFISGSVIPRGDRKLINIITSLGGRIVGDDIWTGIIPYLDLNIKEISPEGIALGYLNRTPHGALPYLELKTDKRLKKLHGLLDEYKAQGVIYHTLRYCDPYTFKAKETKDVLAQSGIPLLEIHTEYAGSDYEAIRTRVEAFVEMIRNQTIESEEEVSA